MKALMYHTSISRGGLTVPSLADLVNKDFGLLDSNFLCNEYSTSAMLSITKIIVNVFYNNKQRIANYSVLKDTIVGF